MSESNSIFMAPITVRVYRLGDDLEGFAPELYEESFPQTSHALEYAHLMVNRGFRCVIYLNGRFFGALGSFPTPSDW